MKKLFLFSFLLSSFSLMSQNYASMLSNSSTWNYMSWVTNSGSNIDYEFYENYKTTGDTLVNGISYTKIDSWNETIGGIREDLNLGKVYFKSFEYDCALDSLGEFLAYDYTLVEGDTFFIKYNISDCSNFLELGLEVIKVDSVELETGEMRKRWEFYDYSYNITGTFYFVEGVGSMVDLLYFINGPHDGWHSSTFLVCQYIGEEINFSNPNRPSWTVCYLDPATSIEIPKVKKLQIFPNPVTSFLEIKGLEIFSSEATIEIFDLNGISFLESKFPQKEIDVSKFPKGIYFLLVENKDQVWLEKFVKM